MKYPAGKIKCFPPQDPTEFVCELDDDGRQAIAVIKESEPHYHRQTREIYTVLRGTLRLHLGDATLFLQEGDRHEIPLNTVHWAEGDWAWVQVDCTPGWTQTDHILAEGKP